MCIRDSLCTVRCLVSETAARYRDWVEANRRRVHEATGGRVGYVHIPDMGANGYAEFHRGFLAELHRDGLVVDVRYNSGGHVSQLILEKLARRRLGYDVQRWGEPVPYPLESLGGPIVLLINEQTGSDGDMSVSYTHLDVYKRQAGDLARSRARAHRSGHSQRHAHGGARRARHDADHRGACLLYTSRCV